ncbi:DUF6506 family protein [Nocardiopsis flavescens]|uniref:Uncharacterized protein n=1 Tax=Nocardiopsis flavescens TaxID=758803 RepID=A0A1M6HFT4_9ACTN|nr:DUF6506 family protein [Nocardiopsis flavescens]SHJ21056.1 hypothetical protein SAMN05421803_104166 [Nocardiopsis flavescens]
MNAVWAYIYEHPESDPGRDRTTLDRAGQTTHLVPVPRAADAPALAVELVGEGVGLIELCGGFSLEDAAAVARAVDGRVPVGHVAFAADSLRAAAAYAARFD